MQPPGPEGGPGPEGQEDGGLGRGRGKALRRSRSAGSDPRTGRGGDLHVHGPCLRFPTVLNAPKFKVSANANNANLTLPGGLPVVADDARQRLRAGPAPGLPQHRDWSRIFR